MSTNPIPSTHSNSKSTRSITTTLTVALYGPSSLFAHSVIAPSPPINRLNFSRGKQTSLADLYQTQNGYLFLIFNDEPDKMKELHFADFIAQHFTFSRGLVLSSISRSVLQEPSNNSLGVITTSSWKDGVYSEKFHEGLMGIQAELVIWGELNEVPISCYIGILGEYQLNAEIIDSVFGPLRGKEGLQENREIFDRIKKYNMKKYSNKLYL